MNTFRKIPVIDLDAKQNPLNQKVASATQKLEEIKETVLALCLQDDLEDLSPEQQAQAEALIEIINPM